MRLLKGLVYLVLVFIALLALSEGQTGAAIIIGVFALLLFRGLCRAKAKQIKKKAFDEMSVYEKGQVYEADKLAQVDEAVETLGCEMEKSWNTAQDDRVSDECRKNEESGWIDKDVAFPSGHDMPPARAGCRCNAQYRLKKD